MSETQTAVSLNRIADQMNLVLTQIFRRYVAQGSPTKLGGLRFLDVESSKTFAFEKSLVSDDKKGNLLVLSAPFAGKEKDIEPILKAGPHGKDIRHLNVRASRDAGKADKFFVEVGYFVPTLEWVADENIIAFAKEHKMNSANEALNGILEEKLLPMADEIMDFIIHHLRAN